MTTPIEIANQALALIRSGTSIAAFSENSREANVCQRFYFEARNDAFSVPDVDWGFARRYAELAEVLDRPPVHWRHVYRYPTNCMMVRGIEHKRHHHGDANLPYPWPEPERHHHHFHHRHEIEPFEVASDGHGRLIMTNVRHAILRYTAMVDDPNQWSAPFRDALAFLLASRIAIPITGDPQLAQANMQGYQQALSSAGLHAQMEDSQVRQQHVPSGVAARDGWCDDWHHGFRR